MATVHPGRSACHPRTRLLLWAALLLVAAAPAVGQGLSAGDRVRIDTGGQRRTYRFREIRGDTLVMDARYGVIVRVPMASVRRVEVGIPRSRGESIVRAAAFGTAIGAGAGLLFGGMASRGCEDDRSGSFAPDFCGLETMSEYGGWGAALGVIAGSVAGALTTSWRWRTLPRKALSPRVAPAGGGVSFGFSW